jgi:CBS domain-containing protein
MFVSDWMTKKVFTVSPEDNVSLAIKALVSFKTRGIKISQLLLYGC